MPPSNSCGFGAGSVRNANQPLATGSAKKLLPSKRFLSYGLTNGMAGEPAHWCVLLVGSPEVIPPRMAIRGTMSGTFELYCDHAQSFGFRLKAPDGSVVAVSLPFPDKASAVQGIRDVRECAGMGLITDLCGPAGGTPADSRTRRPGSA